jgi:hypothetical protein
MRIDCCCDRQIVQNQNPDKYITIGPVIKMGPNKWCCAECSKDLDENGLFPEERN